MYVYFYSEFMFSTVSVNCGCLYIYGKFKNIQSACIVQERTINMKYYFIFKRHSLFLAFISSMIHATI